MSAPSAEPRTHAAAPNVCACWARPPSAPREADAHRETGSARPVGPAQVLAHLARGSSRKHSRRPGHPACTLLSSHITHMPQPSRLGSCESHTPLPHIPCPCAPARTTIITFTRPMTPSGRGMCSKLGTAVGPVSSLQPALQPAATAQGATRGALGLARACCSMPHASLPAREPMLRRHVLLAGELRRLRQHPHHPRRHRRPR